MSADRAVRDLARASGAPIGLGPNARVQEVSRQDRAPGGPDARSNASMDPAHLDPRLLPTTHLSCRFRLIIWEIRA